HQNEGKVAHGGQGRQLKHLRDMGNRGFSLPKHGFTNNFSSGFLRQGGQNVENPLKLFVSSSSVPTPR
ncbi:MAG TPA: hypothetical protein VD994_05825, partial [Prosthecobacter sp.]|nr:hypothetical protein [Prosthecobacter sp.]